ncbi:MAG: hypothetical protein M1829_003673 [Trizodia sp. TS-e1964]|nr:MAG: hypothetical protein M1829_003673 [Trizodia sp. TS-e1964]
MRSVLYSVQHILAFAILLIAPNIAAANPMAEDTSPAPLTPELLALDPVVCNGKLKVLEKDRLMPPSCISTDGKYVRYPSQTPYGIDKVVCGKFKIGYVGKQFVVAVTSNPKGPRYCQFVGMALDCTLEQAPERNGLAWRYSDSYESQATGRLVGVALNVDTWGVLAAHEKPEQLIFPYHNKPFNILCEPEEDGASHNSGSSTQGENNAYSPYSS